MDISELIYGWGYFIGFGLMIAGILVYALIIKLGGGKK